MILFLGFALQYLCLEYFLKSLESLFCELNLHIPTRLGESERHWEFLNEHWFQEHELCQNFELDNLYSSYLWYLVSCGVPCPFLIFVLSLLRWRLLITSHLFAITDIRLYQKIVIDFEFSFCVCMTCCQCSHLSM